MAYVSSNAAPQLSVGLPGRGSSTAMLNFGGNHWVYIGSTDALAAVITSSYFSDGYTRGMRKYDTMMFVDVNTTLTHLLTVSAQSTASGGVSMASQLTT